MIRHEYYAKLKKFSLFKSYYLVVDSPYQHIAHHMATNRVDGWCDFYSEKESKYYTAYCVVRKKDEARFIEALQSFPRTMMLCGYRDYLKDAPAVIDSFVKEFNLC